MRKLFLLTFVLSILTISPIKAIDLDGTFGFNCSLNSIVVKYLNNESSEEHKTDTLNYISLGAFFATDITNNLTLGITGGYSFKNLTGPFYFEQLPISLKIEGESFNSMYFGILADYQFFYVKDFSLNLSGEITYYKLFEINKTIDFPIVQGEASIRNTFITATVDLLIKFDQIKGMTIYLGPELHLLTGKFKATESLGNISGEESITFNQEKFFSVISGVQFEILELFELKVQVRFLSQFSLNCGILYEF